MFAINEYVYYASEGVCRIADICRAPLKGMPEDRQYYVLHSVHSNGGVLYVPTDSDGVFLRRLLTADEADRLVDEIPKMQVFEEPNAKALRLRYIEAMHTHAPEEWIRVIKTVRGRMERLSKGARAQRLSEKLFQFMLPLLFLLLWNGQQRIHILLDGFIFLRLASGGLVLRKEPFPFCGEIGKLRFHAFCCRQRHSAQAL